MWWLLVGMAWATLGYDEVMAAVDARIPELAAAEAKRTAAEAKADAARAPFDPVLSAGARQYGGKYPREVLDGSVGIETAWGPSASVGLLRGRGQFPAYDGMLDTPDGGEVRLRADVPLLDGLVQGEARAAVQAAEARLQGAEDALADKRLETRWKAAQAYWTWVAWSQVVVIEEEQLRIARARDAALAREVEEGTRAPVDRLDNERVLLEREARVVDAQRKQAISAQKLSLWLRDGSGAPRVPGADEAPLDWTAPEGLPSEALDVEQALSRPEVRVVDAALAETRVLLNRARNALLPTLDAYAQLDQALQGGTEEWVVGAKASVQPWLRKERGTLMALRAEETSLLEARRALSDRARAEVSEVRTSIEAHAREAALAAEGALRAREVMALEARRVEIGASDLFALLLREEALAKAEKVRVEAELGLRLALAEREAVIGR